MTVYVTQKVAMDYKHCSDKKGHAPYSSILGKHKVFFPANIINLRILYLQHALLHKLYNSYAYSFSSLRHLDGDAQVVTFSTIFSKNPEFTVHEIKVL